MEKLLFVAMCLLLSLIIGVVTAKLVGFGLSKVLERKRYKVLERKTSLPRF